MKIEPAFAWPSPNPFFLNIIYAIVIRNYLLEKISICFCQARAREILESQSSSLEKGANLKKTWWNPVRF